MYNLSSVGEAVSSVRRAVLGLTVLEEYDQELQQYDIEEMDITGKENTDFYPPSPIGVTYDRHFYVIQAVATPAEADMKITYREILGPETGLSREDMIEKGEERMEEIKEFLSGYTDEINVTNKSRKH